MVRLHNLLCMNCIWWHQLRTNHAYCQYGMPSYTPLNLRVLYGLTIFRSSRTSLFIRLHLERSASIHMSSAMGKKRKTREEKNYKEIIHFRPKPKYPVVKLWVGITVAELARRTERKVGQVFEAMTYIEDCAPYKRANSAIHDRVILFELAKKLGYRIEFIRKEELNIMEEKEQKDLFRRPAPTPEELVKRPPVVTIMGHVDHGKTTLLDALRHTSVAEQEHGGITQHIGAFTVNLDVGQITFLDTPGHAAFYAMRARGARATDIVVLVVAADDGVMEQTLESIRFAREADVPIIVAINKIDKPKADVDHVKRELLGCGIQLEEHGGDVQAVCISALKKMNLDLLLDAILTQAEIMEISGDPKGPVEGVVLESSLDSKKGKLSTALVQRGVLKKGLCLVAGTAWAKVRALFNEHGQIVTEVPPGIPVRVIGWRKLPDAGEIILEAASEKQAQEVVNYRETLAQEEKMEADSIVIKKKLEEHLKKYQAERQDRLLRGRYRKERSYFREKEIVIDEHPFLSVVLKGDVHGSIEALIDVMATYTSHDDCRLDIVHFSVGHLTENDVLLAESFDGIVYCFNVDISPSVKTLAEEKNVPVKTFNVIYHLINDLKDELSCRLPLKREEDVLGEASVLQQFLIKEGKNKVPVAGCKCIKGILKNGSLCKIVRSSEVVYEGRVISLKHEKTDVETIKQTVECGLRVDDPSVTFLPGDSVVCFTERFVERRTDWDPGF